MEISETKKDDSACHTDSKLSLPQKKRQKVHFKYDFLHIKFIFFPFKFPIAKMHIPCSFSFISVCFDKKLNL